MQAIRDVDFRAWEGLPADLDPAEFGVQEWGERPLGESFESAQTALVEMPGYDRPTVYARDGVVVLFDGMNPDPAGGVPALLESLGEPAARLDYWHGTLEIPAGEWPYPDRGITLFMNTDGDDTLHVAVYAPTTLERYLAELRPHRRKRLRPMSG